MQQNNQSRLLDQRLYPRCSWEQDIMHRFCTSYLIIFQKWFDKCRKEEDTDDICLQVAFTLASLHKRYCDSTVSRQNACNKDKEKVSKRT